jgi:hypothetical protein
MTDNLTINLLDKDGDFQIAQHHIKLPFIVSNRSMIVTYYMLEGENESFHFIWSSRGNEGLVATYSKQIGKDVVGEIEGCLHCSKHSDGGTKIEANMFGNPKGSIPDMIKNKMAGKASLWAETVSNMIRKNQI